MNKVTLLIPEHLFLCPLYIAFTLGRFKFNPDNMSFVDKINLS